MACNGVTRRAACALPFVAAAGTAWAQRSGPVIGFLSPRSPEESKTHTAAFLRGLAQGGFESARIEYRWARGDYAKLPDLARELAALPVALVVAGGDPAAIAARGQRGELSLVFLIGGDPVRLGLVNSLNRPQNNATGVSLVTGALGAKRVELLSQAIPGQSAIALIRNPNNPDAEAHTAEVSSACQSLQRPLQVSDASASEDLARLVATISERKVAGAIVQNDPFFDTHRDEIISLCLRYRVPAIFHVREYPDGGGLMSYGPSLTTGYHELGLQAARVLERKATHEVPVVQSARFEFVINLKTAQALGLELPPSVLLVADEMVE